MAGTYVFPADGVEGPGVDELVACQGERYNEVLDGPFRNMDIGEVGERTITANPLARILNGRISKVYAMSIGVYAKS